MITWWHVYPEGLESFGFSSRDGIILNFPEWKMKGGKLSDVGVRMWFLNRKAQVVKICDQYEPSDISQNKQLEPDKVNNL